MAIDSAPYVGLLDEKLPTDKDPRVEGAAQIRAVKTALANSFPNVKGEVKATHDQMNNIFAQGMTPGMILMFTGDTAPDGWAFCDGGIYNNFATPDLRNKFIHGWNPQRTGVDPGDVIKIKDKGGSHKDINLSKYLSSEPHKLTVPELPEDPVKMVFDSAMDNGDNSGGEHYLVPKGGGHRGWKDAPYEFVLGKGNAHKHGLVAAADKAGIFDKRPEWYALAYICYVGLPPA